MNSAKLLTNFGNALKESLAKENFIFTVDLYIHIAPVRARGKYKQLSITEATSG